MTRSAGSSEHRGRQFVSVTDALAAIAASWGVLMALSPLLQIRRVLDRRSSADISTSCLAVLQVGFTLWIAYGFALGNAAIVVLNSVAFLVGAATILIALRFRDATSEGWFASDEGRKDEGRQHDPEEEQHGGDAELSVRDGGDVAWLATEHDGALEGFLTTKLLSA